MAIPVQDILERVTDLLLDKDRDDADARWTTGELIRWVNDCRMAILTRAPQANAKFSVVTLDAGTFQNVPDDAVTLLDVIRNMGTGSTPGRAIRRTDRQNIDDVDPYWHKATAKSEVSQFTYDDRMPKVYFVSPPVVAGTKVQIAYSAMPTQITATTDSLGFSMEYMDAVVNYVAYRAKSKDSEYANAAEAAAFYGAFADALSSNAQSKSAVSPNQPGNSV